jgi:hypothetical protein
MWRDRSTSGDQVFQWVLPGLFVLGGVIGELVAVYGRITGTVWHNS